MKVLDKGFINLIDVTDDGDKAIVQAARVSFGQTPKDDKRDRILIDYLLENGHETPFEHVTFKFHVKCPLFTARQWMRHRWCSFNEISARYTEIENEWYVPDKKRELHKTNTQGSEESNITDNQHQMFSTIVDDMSLAAYNNYQGLLATGTARELARIVLPQNMYTQFYWTINARSLMNFMKLRLHSHAQLEIRKYAIAIQIFFEEELPWTASAFKEYILNV